MSEAEYYWPLSGEVGIYDILTDKGQFYEWEWADGKWRCPTSRTIKATTEQMQKWGYLGVRREQQKIDEHAEEIAQLKADAAKARADVFDWMRVVSERDAEIKQLRDEIARVGEQASTPDLTALVREAIVEFRRDVKQPTKAADWAFRWANRFIEAVEQ